MRAENTGPASGAMGTNPLVSAGTARLFLALWPDASARRALCACQDAWHWPPGARVVPPEKLHVTMHFLGDIPASRVGEVVAGLSVRFTPFELSLHRAFKWRRHLVVAAPDSVLPAYRDLHARLSVALRRLGIRVDPRSAHPHVTLARRAGMARLLRGGEDRAGVELRDVRWMVTGYVLVQSVPPGAYRVVHHYPAS